MSVPGGGEDGVSARRSSVHFIRCGQYYRCRHEIVAGVEHKRESWGCIQRVWAKAPRASRPKAAPASGKQATDETRETCVSGVEDDELRRTSARCTTGRRRLLSRGDRRQLALRAVRACGCTTQNGNQVPAAGALDFCPVPLQSLQRFLHLAHSANIEISGLHFLYHGRLLSSIISSLFHKINCFLVICGESRTDFSQGESATWICV